MRFSGKLALRVGAIGVAAGAILLPISAANAVTAPTLTVTPSTGLTDGQSVALVGSGFAPSTPYFVSECSALTGAAACDSTPTDGVQGTTDATGGFTANFTVKEGAIGTGTCPPATATDPCYLVATTNPAAGDATNTAVAPITFAATTTGPALTVTPSTGLSDGQTVTVTGTGFDPSVPFAITECSGLPSTTTCDSTGAVVGTTGADGTIPATPFKVKEGTVGSGTCPPAAATDTCYIAATTDLTGADTTKGTAVPISFGTPAGPTVTVKPSTNVKSGSNVTVSGSGFAPKKPLYAVECSGTSGEADCDTSALGQGTTDASGAFTGVKVPVHSGAVGGGTCNAGQTCYIAATTDPTGTDASQSGFGTFSFGKGGTSGPAKTKTHAKFSRKHSEITGTVTSHGAGVKGVKTELELRHAHHWKTVDTAKTHSGGAFTYKHVTKSGKYEVKALKSHKYKGSTSKKIKV